MMEERVYLSGNKTEKIIQALKKAGWYEGRKVDISEPVNYFHKYEIELFSATTGFLEEFMGLLHSGTSKSLT